MCCMHGDGMPKPQSADDGLQKASKRTPWRISDIPAVRKRTH